MAGRTPDWVTYWRADEGYRVSLISSAVFALFMLLQFILVFYLLLEPHLTGKPSANLWPLLGWIFSLIATAHSHNDLIDSLLVGENRQMVKRQSWVLKHFTPIGLILYQVLCLVSHQLIATLFYANAILFNLALAGLCLILEILLMLGDWINRHWLGQRFNKLILNDRELKIWEALLLDGEPIIESAIVVMYYVLTRIHGFAPARS